MIRYLLIALIFFNVIYTKSEFIKLCEYPILSQLHTLDTLIKQQEEEYKTLKKDCKDIEAFLKYKDKSSLLKL